MLSWNPESYVSEAVSRILAEEAKQGRGGAIPSYYDAVTSHLEAHELSKSIKVALEEQRRQNIGISCDIGGNVLEILFNPVDIEDAGVAEERVKKCVADIGCLFGNVSDELNSLNGKSGLVAVSEDVLDILHHLQSMGLLTNFRFNPVSEKLGCILSATDRSSILKSMVLYNSQVEWPKGMTLNFTDYMKAWLVDRVAARLEVLNEHRGCLIRLEDFARVFGTSRGSSVWKYGVSVSDLDGEQKFIGCLELDALRPTAAAHAVEDPFFDHLGMQSCVACCRTTTTSYCLANALSVCSHGEKALFFVREWREVNGPESKDSLLSFTLYFGYGKPISDEGDVRIGENDDKRIYLHSEKDQIVRTYKQMGDVKRYESHVETVIANSKNADLFHNISGYIGETTCENLERAMSLFPRMCVVATCIGNENAVCVSVLKAADVLRGDATFVFCISQRSPLFNHVFAPRSQVTLNFLFDNAQAVCQAINDTYPLWINEIGNEPVVFESESRTYVTTKALMDISKQVAFETAESFLVGEEVLVVGRCLDSIPSTVVINVKNTLVLQDHVPPQEFYPFLFTIVHKIYGTVGFVGYGCQLCSLSPLTMYIYSPIESSQFALDEVYTGPKCNLTFLSSFGAPIFDGKDFEELGCGMPMAASSVSSLPQQNIYFQVEGMLIRIVRDISDKYVICVVAANECRFNQTDPCKLLVRPDDERLIPA
ncbi:hypothetical protein, conserved [Trypanosoma brucei gambiense DAL972]|uniref:Uncharacterized protein n=1 Tax=Trypanosoma brucei gambiense (strain MHOM/CI/86/DAL972) TaxID=679716 RepID=C9ZUX3_TRYB9|nr:hypothetical protein, conserved [Trypanosoma brucei gambiense DAL972]CBH13211.1 hypothetical protein, conserved [Trypanosoma brucei gambiense DAL972]|eukprot:XP_011775488.1 hypothetical protein, conserved [Trypanosoma brucei gambiense DAL972]